MAGTEFDPSVERADEVEDYSGEVPRVSPQAGAGGHPSTRRDASTGFGDGDVADVDGGDVSNADVFLDVDALLAERDQLKDVAMRVQADFENYRKRAAAQHAADVDRATGRLAEALLPVLDAAEAAYVQHPDEIGPLLTVLLTELRKHGLETLDLARPTVRPGSRRRRRPPAGRWWPGGRRRSAAQRLPLARQDAAPGDGANDRLRRRQLETASRR